MTVPITILTGFLGSGKTTLLNHALRGPRLARALVVVNELGEIGIDHLLVREVREDVLLLESGCVCCSIRGDLVEVLAQAAASTSGPPFERVIVETTGFADPTPIVGTLVRHPALADVYHLDAVVTAVDAELGPRTLATHEEAAKQVMLADDLVLTKCDRVEDDAARARLRATLAALNPTARTFQAARGELDWEPILAWNASTVSARLDPGRLDPGRLDRGRLDRGRQAEAPHGAGPVRSFAVRVERAVDFRMFALWLSMVTQLHAERLLRVKGLLRVEGEKGPLVVQAVQHVVHPTYTMPAWPGDDRATRVVALTRGMDAAMVAELRASLVRLLGAERPGPAAREQPTP